MAATRLFRRIASIADHFRTRVRRRRDPTAVFTPRAVASGGRFVRRTEPDLRGNASVEARLRNALREPGAQILIYGDAGVGKSSLLVNVAADTRTHLVRVPCLSGRTYEDLMRDVLGQMLSMVETGFSVTDIAEHQHERGVAAKVLSVKGTYKRSYGRSRTFQSVQREPADILLEAMEATGHDVLVLDNFQNLDGGQDRLLVMQTMERLSDLARETGNKKICVIGIAEDSAQLLAGSPSFARRVIEVGVPRMPDAEIAEILDSGFRSLGLDCDDGAFRSLIFYADGFPYFAHLLGLEVTRIARELGVPVISQEMLQTALARTAQQVERSYEERVRRAIESQGVLRPRHRVLELLARSPHRQWSSGEVTELYAVYFDEPRHDWSFLATALTQLTSEQHGSILRQSGPVGSYAYTFSDPHMRPYLRLAMFDTPLERTVRGLHLARVRARREIGARPPAPSRGAGTTPDLSSAHAQARIWGAQTGGALMYDEIVFLAEVEELVRADRRWEASDWASESYAISGPTDSPELIVFLRQGSGAGSRRIGWSWPLRGDPLASLDAHDAVDALWDFAHGQGGTDMLGEDDEGTRYYRAKPN